AVANAGMYDYALRLVGACPFPSVESRCWSASRLLPFAQIACCHLPKLSFDRRMHMPKFLRIGVHQSNVSGYTSKAWCIRRVGSTVFLKWGAVEVRGVGDGRKICWTQPPREKTIHSGTVERAKDYAKAAIARRRNHRYEPLAGNIVIRRRPADRSPDLDQVLATILFIDIVRSTEKAARLGDARWTQVMNHYYAAARRELKALRGKEVVTTGDGLLATFRAPDAGIRCATAIREAVRTLGLEIRGGLHAGDYKVSGAELVGLA